MRSVQPNLQAKEFSVRNLLRKMNVKMVCTTDDPVDSLEYHQKIKDDAFETPILPAFRPDNAMNVSDRVKFLDYIKKAGSNNQYCYFII
ncbi:MAG: glucuronate isomerase [Bacteroidota bacterium]